jgi:hypothetical protein
MSYSNIESEYMSKCRYIGSKFTNYCEVSGSHGGDYEDDCLLGCSAA